MKNLSRKNVFLVVLVLAVLTMIVGLFLVDSGFAKILLLGSILAVSATVLATNLEKDGPLSILLMASPLLSTLFSKLSKFGLANSLTESYNKGLSWLFSHLEIESNFSLGNEDSLLITFWLLVAVIYGSITIVKWNNAREKKPEFREKNYSEKRAAFCLTLRQRIERINRETDWNESTFTPLDAEIEACFNKKRKKKFDDLLKCLKAYRRRNTVFLVLGDPGAGKSVAMRKLCLDLLDDVKNTGLVPVYIDLKKWKEPWTINNLPTKNDLLTFIKFILKENGDFSADDFVDVYFDKMLENGRWYFVFDSFDELPCLMGMKNCKQLIDELSELLYTFLTGPNQRGGVISSRLFRSPTDTLRPAVTMTIQPFNDIKIKTMLKRYSSSTVDTDKKLFGQREDLVALCRNPFYLSLLINYYKQNSMKLPANQMELFKSFVDGRLNRCSGKIELEGMTVDQIRNAATELAMYMEESPEYGLECPVRALASRNAGKDWGKILELLAYAKICRFGGTNETVSFVHRRFQEFFHVEHIVANQETISRESYKSILHNNGLRDALVLYCEIAEETRVREIAKYCWNIVQSKIDTCNNIRKVGCSELVNTLYFMAEAFRNRREVILDFLKDFQDLVEIHLTDETDFAVQLALANSMILFDQKTVQGMVLKVLELRNRWLSDIVMLNCRTITTKLDRKIEKMITRYFREMEINSFFSRYRNTEFSLSLSRPFAYLRIMHKWLFGAYLIFFAMACVSSVHMISLSLYMPSSLLQVYQVDLNGVFSTHTNSSVEDALLVSAYLPLLSGLKLFRYQRKERTLLAFFDKTFWYDVLSLVMSLWFGYLACTLRKIYLLVFIPYFLFVGGCEVMPFCVDFLRNIHDKKKRRRLLLGVLFCLAWMTAAYALIRVFDLSRVIFKILLGFLGFVVGVTFICMLCMLIISIKKMVYTGFICA